MLNGNMERYPIPEPYADKLRSALTIYKREKALYCCAFFVIGRQQEVLRRESKICAPIFLYPAELTTDEDGSYLAVDLSRRQININFLNSIKKEGVDDLYDSISSHVHPQIRDLGDIGNLRKIIEMKVEDTTADDLLLYPMLYGEEKLKRKLQPKNLDQAIGYEVIPSIAFGMFKRSTSTRGIISELQHLTTASDYSEPLRYLLTGAHSQPDMIKPGRVPAILSESQREVIDGANRNTCTLVIGPPGTGKSYTIAALALDFLSKGKKVLIASKTDEAVDVIQEKISQDLGIAGISLRAGKSGYKKKLKAQLETLLTQTRRRPSDERPEDLEVLADALESLDKDIRTQEDRFKKQVVKEMRWGNYLARYGKDAHFLRRLKLRYIKWKNSLQDPHWVVTKKFLEQHEAHILKVREYIDLTFSTNVHRSLYHSRSMFRDFLKSLTARTSARQASLFENIHLPTLLNTFPIWLVNMADIHEVLPLKEEIFDLAIIDEASQCDIASSIPIIQRARRLVVVGDPKQLRHVSFLSGSVQQALKKKNKLASYVNETVLDYRNTSMLDLVNDQIANQKQVIFLNEHFRSKPDLIRFSNENFYNGDLSVMTNNPEKDHVSHIHVERVYGKRNKKGYNVEEADRILLKIKSIIEKEKELGRGLSRTIGILSPFRDQVLYLGNRLTSEIDAKNIEKHQISCGTAYSFQGSEKDIMLLSMTIDEESHHSAVIHLNKPDVFNVSITRARSLQILYTSFSNLFNPGGYLSKYLQDSENDRSSVIKSGAIRDAFLSEVIEAISTLRFPYWINYTVAGLQIDLVFKAKNHFYGINLIGFPGHYVDALGMSDYKILRRAGLSVFPLPYTYWKLEEVRCFQELLKFCET